MEKIIYNCSIITQNKNRKIIPRGYIVFGEKIKKVGEGNPSKNFLKKYESYDLRGQIITPGFINTHIHLGETLFRRIVKKNTTLHSYLKITENFYKKNPQIESKRKIISNYSLLLATKSGTTTICGGRVRKYSRTWGIRNISGFMLMKSAKLSKYYDRSMVLQNALRQSTELNKTGVFIHSLNTVDQKKLEQIQKLLLKIHSPFIIMIHVAESLRNENEIKKKWGAGSVTILNNYKLLTPHTLLIHGTFFTNNDLTLIKKYKVKIAHCPSSNLLLSGHTLQIKKLLNKGIRCSIATDGYATSGTLDVLEEARRAYLIHKKKISAQQIFDMITIDAAHCLSIERITGSLEKKKYADFTIIKPQSRLKLKRTPRLLLTQKNTVTGVIVNGKWLWKNEKLKNRNQETRIEKDYLKLEKELFPNT